MDHLNHNMWCGIREKKITIKNVRKMYPVIHIWSGATAKSKNIISRDKNHKAKCVGTIFFKQNCEQS